MFLDLVSLMRLQNYLNNFYKESIMRKDVYCDMAFLLTCVSKLKDNTLANFESYEEYKLWNSIFHSLLYSSKIRLHLDIEYNKYENELNNIEKERKKAARKGREYVMSLREQVLFDIDIRQRNQELHLVLNEPNPLRNNYILNSDKQYNGIYLACVDSVVCQKLMNEYGILATVMK